MDTRLFRRPHIIRYESTCYAFSHVDSSILVHPDLLTLGKSDDDDKDFDDAPHAKRNIFTPTQAGLHGWTGSFLFRVPCK